MSVFHAPESAYAKELKKWEYGNPHEGYRGYRTHEEYPRMLYRGVRTASGPVTTEQVIVGSDDERDNMASRGWHLTQEAALEAFHAQDRDVATLAAERHYHERHMSEAAQREIAEHEASTDAHLPSIPETPIRRKPGRPPKTDPV